MLRAEDNQFPTGSGAGTPMGELPDLEMALVPPSQRCVSKKWQVCNWVQAIEGSIDTAHFTFAHQDRHAVRSGACVTNKSKDLPAVMVERFGDAAGFVGRPQIAAAE